MVIFEILLLSSASSVRLRAGQALLHWKNKAVSSFQSRQRSDNVDYVPLFYQLAIFDSA